ncbi:hypothetical protein [Streptomyces sp. NPDC058457]|uniref:hypothetical protein n=1 Tax=Streptomyces sp. NPDC058457 TaxID=3346507 RepID=UPI00365EE0CF
MMSSTRPGDGIAVGLITQDLMFLRRFLQSAVAAGTQIVVPMFCMHNYICLIVHESHRALQQIAPDVAGQLAYDCAPAIERARHSVKLFDDKKKDVDGVRADFNQVICAHRAEFLNNTWLPLARPLERDLVLWRYQDRVIWLWR